MASALLGARRTTRAENALAGGAAFPGTDLEQAHPGGARLGGCLV